MIVKEEIKLDILDMFDILKEIKDSEEAKIRYAELLSDIIYNTITKAEVVAGQAVTTTGTATNQAGFTTTNGTII